MYRKSFGECITRVITYDSRITAVILQSKYGPVLFVSVYMPTDYGDADCYEEYVAICGKITALFAESDACLLYTSPSPRDRQKSRMPSSA